MKKLQLTTLIALIALPATADAQRNRADPIRLPETQSLSREEATARLVPGAVRARKTTDIFEKPEPQDTSSGLPAFRPLRVAKWSVLAAAAGAGVYGFIRNGEADDEYSRLEQMCQNQQVRCADRTATGEYSDPEFERLFQRVKSLDDRSHTALLVSQIGVATGVVLFLLDLGNVRSPGDIPFAPSGLEITPSNGRLDLSVRLPLPNR